MKNWLKKNWEVLGILCLGVATIIYFCLVFAVLIPTNQNRIYNDFLNTQTELRLPFREVEINTPIYTMIAHNITEFKEAIRSYNATTIYYRHSYNSWYELWVFRIDGIEATKYTIR